MIILMCQILLVEMQKDGLKRGGNRQLNELIAEVLLQEKKGIVKR